MFSENRWKVFLLVAASVTAAEPSRALSLVYQPYKNVVFVPKNYYRRSRSRVLFLDESESRQPFGRGEIDLTVDKVKFDDSDYEFTSPEEPRVEATTQIEDGGNERFYEPLPRFRQFQTPQYYQGRFGRPYAPSFGFDPYQTAVPSGTSPYQTVAPAVPNPYQSPALRAGFYNGWKARSPRVVFPYATDSATSVHTNSHGGPASLDNVVFRDQNFGLNEVGTDEQTLQDIGNGNDAFAERDTTDQHRAKLKTSNKLERPMFVQTQSVLERSDIFANVTATVLPEFKPISDAQMVRITQIVRDLRKRTGRVLHGAGNANTNVIADAIKSANANVKPLDKSKKEDRQDEKKCSQGGTCEFFFYCWMVGGLLDGSCGGLLKGCCHRVAKSGILGVQDPNSIDSRSRSEREGFSYGPVINDQSCGIAVGKQTAQRRIVGGDDAGFGTFPWQAYIRIGSSRCNMLMSIFELIGWKQCWIERCGGSLISRRHVVTAGHCVARAQPRHVRVTLGDYVINSAAEPLPAYTFGVRSIKVHPLFKFTPQADRFDVAVLTLDRNVHYMPHIAPICLPERGSEFLGQYGWAAGWGALSPGSRLRPRTLQAVDVPVLDNRVCERWHRANGINVVIYPEMLCAGYKGGGKDSCQGDSGGPLMLERAGRWYLIGVVSAGYSCASRGQPGIYHRVAHTVDWISHATTLS
ncbi:hypothetical protein ACJJTC_005719 [Scirpophaga incertulas]